MTDYEAEVDRMAAELKASGDYPESLAMLDRAALDCLARYGLPRPLLAEAILRDTQAPMPILEP